MRPLQITTSTLASTFRGWRGTMAYGLAREPERSIELYEFENCPYCRLVREALTELDLDAMIYPCPKGGTRFRPQVEAMGGKGQFPYLVDPNTGERMFESADIIAYLYRTYAGREAPRRLLLRPLAVTASSFASAARGLRGMRARPSHAPEKALELYSFESSPFSRLVRELLCELEIPYLLRNMGKAQMADMGPPVVRRSFFKEASVAGRNRERLFERTGRLQVPYLVDPNTGTEMFESADIRAYLLERYGQTE